MFNGRIKVDMAQNNLFWCKDFLPPATKLTQGYIFTGVCDSVHGGACVVAGGHAWLPGGMCGCQGACVVAGGGVCMVAGGCTCLGGMHGCQGVCMEYDEIRSMSGRYASYWNAFLFIFLNLRGDGKLYSQIRCIRELLTIVLSPFSKNAAPRQRAETLSPQFGERKLYSIL